jgi:quinolinate synthase
MKIWQGACIVHATFPRASSSAARAAHPNALVAAHPECPPGVLDMADFIGSTSAIVDWCVTTDAAEFIVMTESGVGHSLKRRAPEKQFYFVPNENCNCSECPYMRRNTLEKLRDALAESEPAHRPCPGSDARARLPIERMLAVR